ncbi:GTPase-activating protein [Tulasnella sp. 418]|nr:GTPase-activating protein [Tulasnella sp. 418]
MITVTEQGTKLDRRFDELASALEMPSTTFSTHDDFDDGFDGHSQALNFDPTFNKFSSSPTTPTSSSVASSSWSITQSASSSHFASSSSSATVGSSGAYGITTDMPPSLEDISLRSDDLPESGDRFSIVTSTTSSDRFSTVALKTPTTGNMSPPLFPVGAAEPLPGLEDALQKASEDGYRPGPSTSITDEEEDLGTTHAGNYGGTPHKRSRELKDLTIRTDLQITSSMGDKEDTQRTPIAGVSAGASVEAKSMVEPLKSPMRPESGNVSDFLLAKLNKDKSRRSGRASIEGREKLQEEFQRLQDEQRANGQVKGETVTPSMNSRMMAAGDDEKVDWDFWGLVVASYETVASEQPEKLARAIQRGIPPALRGMVWQLMYVYCFSSPTTELLKSSSIRSTSKDAELEKTYASLLKETSPHEKAITRDLGRTFPQHAFFMDGQGVGQENLFNVLKAYSLYDPEVGYCQGLAFIGAALLLNMPDEEAFCVLVRLMYSYGSRDMYLPEMPGLQLRLFQFDRLVEELLPVLHVHFVRQGIKSSMYCSQWFLTMFSYRFPLDLVFRIFDSVFGHGIEAIFGFSMILLIKNEEKLLQLK